MPTRYGATGISGDNGGSKETGELALSGDRGDVPSRDETKTKKRHREGDGNNKMSTYGPGTGNPFEVSKSDNKKVKGEGDDRGINTNTVSSEARNEQSYLTVFISKEEGEYNLDLRMIGDQSPSRILDHQGRLSRIGPLSALVDTGAAADNYISKGVAERLRGAGCPQRLCNTKICSGIGAAAQFCVTCQGIFKFKLSYHNDLTNLMDSISIEAKVADIQEDIIIGIPTIREYGLTWKCWKIFGSKPLHTVLTPIETAALGELARGSPVSTSTTPSWWGLESSPLQLTDKPLDIPVKLGHDVTVLNRICDLLPPDRLRGMSAWTRVCRIVRKTDLLTEEPDEDYVTEELEPPVYGSNNDYADGDPEDIINKIHIEGSEKFKKDIRIIIRKYKGCFSETLRSTPAKIEPMRLEVNKQAWQQPKHAGPARQQSDSKQEAIVQQTEDLHSKGIIEVSDAPYYSQVHMTPKAQQKAWRMCIDFRALNAVTTTIGQWIPNIGQLMARIGRARPKVFGVLDLTSGYYQAPLHPDSWIYTAFRCVAGIFHWTRVPIYRSKRCTDLLPSYFSDPGTSGFVILDM